MPWLSAVPRHIHSHESAGGYLERLAGRISELGASAGPPQVTYLSTTTECPGDRTISIAHQMPGAGPVVEHLGGAADPVRLSARAAGRDLTS